MKVLIYFAGAVFFAVVLQILKMLGVQSGAVPTIILGAVTFKIIDLLCSKWEKHKNKLNEQKNNRSEK